MLTPEEARQQLDAGGVLLIDVGEDVTPSVNPT
jgi:hypothetical protein